MFNFSKPLQGLQAALFRCYNTNKCEYKHTQKCRIITSQKIKSVHLFRISNQLAESGQPSVNKIVK